ncbi:hypothetical protein [Pyrococcus kukulkanii]|uniref:hypothetical protein n=1 Tax=Pyrococcus kukulkanii TaxID=1609559 RepID=UPI00356585F7
MSELLQLEGGFNEWQVENFNLDFCFLITFLLVSITYSPVRGLYVLALNSTVLFPWLVLTLNGHGKLPKRTADLLIGVTLVLPLISALSLGVLCRDWNLTMGFIFLSITLL